MFVDWKDATCFIPSLGFAGDTIPLRVSPVSTLEEAGKIARDNAGCARKMGASVTCWVEPSTWETLKNYSRYDDKHTPLYRYAINVDHV